jgi:hypothetical protein
VARQVLSVVGCRGCQVVVVNKFKFILYIEILLTAHETLASLAIQVFMVPVLYT